MLQQLHWIFITLLSLTLAIAALSSDPVALWDTSVTDWLVAAGTFGSVLIAAIAAIFLKRTLESAQRNNALLMQQIASHGPVLILENDHKGDYYFPGEELPIFIATCQFTWNNASAQAAVNARFGYQLKDHQNQELDVVGAIKQAQGAYARSFHPNNSSEITLSIQGNLDQFKKEADGLVTLYFSCFVLYQDSIGHEYISEQGYRFVLVPSTGIQLPNRIFHHRAGPNGTRRQLSSDSMMGLQH